MGVLGSSGRAVRVFISYAHDSPEHEGLVRQLWVFLRACGIDARLDLAAAADRVDWAEWMTREARDADRVLVIASAAYKRRAEGDAGPDEGRGVQWEARLIRDLFYADQQAGMRRFVPVVLPGGSAGDIPLWLAPASAAYYEVGEFTVAGAESLLRLLTGQAAVLVPELGQVPVLPPRPGGATPAAGAAGRPGVHTEVMIEATISDGVVEASVWAAGSLLGRRRGPVPVEVAGVWAALRLPGVVAGERLAGAGRALAGVLMGLETQAMLAGLAEGISAEDTAEVVLCADRDALGLPVELLRLRTRSGGEVGPLGLLPAVSVCRRRQAWRGESDVPPPRPEPRGGLAGPLKVLAAVAAPEETRTASPPLDAEAEMAAVLDAVAPVTAAGTATQVRILEVASLPAIRQALTQDAYHVLHLSAHGSPEAVELEDEDGNPVLVTAGELMDALRHAGRTVPLIVLSSCSGGASGSGAMAAGLIGRGADRVIAMLAPVTDPYATMLARHIYRELAARPDQPMGLALARARYLAAEQQSRDADRGQVPVPEFGVATLLASGADGPLADPALRPAPLPVVTTPPGGKLVRDLPMGTLIGRRAQLRGAMAVMRRDQAAVDRFGVAGGVVLTGIGGIGKTALAGRVAARLADEGWLVAVHDGRWNPTALIIAVTRAADQASARAGVGGRADGLGAALEMLAGPGDDGPKLAAIAGLLADERLLVVFDDFEQNLTDGGDGFADPAFEEIFAALTEAAEAGALLVTCRYPLPGPDRFLARITVPALSPAELRRMFLRLPALRALEPEDRRVLVRAVGGHPRLIEFTDALLRGGHAGFRHVQAKLRDLARREAADLSAASSVDAAVEQAMLLGSADILLEGLIGLLTTEQAAVLRQVAVCRAPMTLDDLAFALAQAEVRPATGAVAADVARLADLTLVQDGGQIVMHPWTAELVTRNASSNLGGEHDRALAMRYRKFEQQRGTYEDLVDIPRHLAALGRYDDVADIAAQAERALPGTQAAVAYLAEIRPLIPPAERAWILVAEQEFNALLRAGDLGSATRQIHAIHDQVQARAAADPANSGWQRDLSVSHIKLGDVAVAAGDLAAARAAYQASLDIRVRLAAADPANSGWQRDLSVSHIKLGDVAVAAGDLAAARAAYQADLDIAARLAAADPANSGWQRDLSVSHEKLGDLAVAAGDLAAARAAYQASLDIRVRLAAADPANSGWQRDLSVSHEKLGDVAVAAGDLAAARAAYQASLDIRVRLAAADPANSGWQRDLSVSHGRLGDVAVAAGDLAAARAAYQASLDIAVRLAAADPANSGWQRDLSVSQIKLGDVAVAAGDLAAARAAYQASQDIAARLAAADPANSGWQRDLAVSHGRLGDVAVAAGDLAAARAAYQASQDIAARLAAADLANSGWQRDLAVSHDRLGDVAVAAGDLAAARAAYQASLDIRVRLAAADPANSGWQRDLSVSHEKLGDLAVAAGDLAAARAAYQASQDIAVRLAAADPANSGWQRDLSVSHGRLGDVAVAAGDLAAARAAYQASLDIAVRLAAADPANTEWQRDLEAARRKTSSLDG